MSRSSLLLKPASCAKQALAATVAVACLVIASGCTTRRSTTAQYPPYYQPYPQQPPYGQLPPGQQPPASPQQPAPAWGALPPGPPVLNDPLNAVDVNWMRTRAGQIMGELIAALAPAARARVQNIPFVADPTVGEVNAFAACDDQGQALMAISDGLLEIQAYMAQLRATDEIFGTKKLDAYVQQVARDQRPNQPIVKPGALVDPLQHVDSRKVARQHHIFEEAIGFVLGHELGHHHLGHLGCTAGSFTRASASDLNRLLSKAIPAFNQPNEIAADVAGTQNVMNAGKARNGNRWVESGALMTIDFFAALDRLTPATIVFGFERSHPHPIIRRPIIQQTAHNWRSTGGTGFQFPTWPTF